MKHTDERIDFITEYISAYESKIKLNNSLGLTNCARLFETFALEIAKLYFGCTFHNFNDDNPQFPYVDLISDECNIFVQVTTENNLPSKILRTLNKIKKSKKEFAKDIKEVFFIALDNDSVNKVTNYLGAKRIGNIDFNKSKHLITTRMIVQKAQSDLSFRNDLYTLLKKEDGYLEDTASIKLELDDSKNVGLKLIPHTIGGVYHIDMSEYIDSINSDNAKNILIEGKPGSGKSVLCKKICENIKYMFYSLAERFTQETNVDDIWHFNLTRALDFLENEPVYFFIDGLERISDTRTNLELLEKFYNRCSKYNNVRIIASCRSSDKTAFIGLIKTYEIKTYPIKEISQIELNKIAAVFPSVKTALGIDKYKELIKIPFYLNYIATLKNLSDIHDENEFRDYIWEKCICLGNPSYSETIIKIALDRARSFSSGVLKDDYDFEIVKSLISNDIINETSGVIRFKYDIFEDICLEHYIDRCFIKAKNNCKTFFAELELLGKCIFRRYQIWLDDKLLSKNNREKFIRTILFFNDLQEEWKSQTIIGLIKSNHGDSFFEEYSSMILGNESLLKAFIDRTNLFGFEIDRYDNHSNLTILKPSGCGRENLIKMVWMNKTYEKNDDVESIVKMCTDYSSSAYKKDNISQCASGILCYYVDYIIKKSISSPLLKPNELTVITKTLNSIYSFSKHSEGWLDALFRTMREYYISSNGNKRRIAEAVLENLFTRFALPYSLRNQKTFYSLYEFYYTVKKNDDDYFSSLYRENETKELLWGLNDNAESYEHSMYSKKYPASLPFNVLFSCDIHEGLKWIVSFTNKLVNNLNNRVKQDRWSITFFGEKTKRKEYFGSLGMWLSSCSEHQVPIVLSDIIYTFKIALKTSLEAIEDRLDRIKFANAVRDYIYSKSNNVILLSVVSEIGIFFLEELPGYAIDLASNINVIMADIDRLVFDMKDYTQDMAKKGIESMFGLPNIYERRYFPLNGSFSLREYFVRSWSLSPDTLNQKCSRIIKELYSKVPNNESNASKYLQICNMDLKSYKTVSLTDKILIQPNITGDTKKYVESHTRLEKERTNIWSKIDDYNRILSDKAYDTNLLIEMLDFFVSLSRSPLFSLYSNQAVNVLSLIISRDDLNEEMRFKYIVTFVDYGYKVMNDEIVFKDSSVFNVLFEQLNRDINKEAKNKIKKMMLDLLFYNGHNGMVDSLVSLTMIFLKKNKYISSVFFNTILELSRDEMIHQTYNARAVKSSGFEDDFLFQPNKQPHLDDVDFRSGEYKVAPYQKKEKEIIERYLYNENKIDTISNFNLNEYDAPTLCKLFFCEFSLKNELESKIAREFLILVIELWIQEKRFYHSVLSFYDIRIFRRCLERNLVSSIDEAEQLLKIMFDGIDFSLFKKDAIDFYCEVFDILPALYFDAYDDRSKRTLYQRIYDKIDLKISDLKNDNVKNDLSRIMLLAKGDSVRFGNDWKRLTTNYSTEDVFFLNKYYEKYGYLHPGTMLESIERLHLKELMPYVLIPIGKSFKKAKTADSNYGYYSEKLADSVFTHLDFLNSLMSVAFYDYKGSIKEDDELIDSYENVLETLIELKNECAAVFLYEFHTH